MSYLGRGCFAPGLFNLLLGHRSSQVQRRRGPGGRIVLPVHMMLLLTLLIAGPSSSCRTAGSSLRVTVVEELEPVGDMKVLDRDVLLHLGRAEVGGPKGREVPQRLALLLQGHDAVFLEHGGRWNIEIKDT